VRVDAVAERRAFLGWLRSTHNGVVRVCRFGDDDPLEAILTATAGGAVAVAGGDEWMDADARARWLARLNTGRDRLARREGPVIVLADDATLDEFARAAPDWWSWRSEVLGGRPERTATPDGDAGPLASAYSALRRDVTVDESLYVDPEEDGWGPAFRGLVTRLAAAEAPELHFVVGTPGVGTTTALHRVAKQVGGRATVVNVVWSGPQPYTGANLAAGVVNAGAPVAIVAGLEHLASPQVQLWARDAELLDRPVLCALPVDLAFAAGDRLPTLLPPFSGDAWVQEALAARGLSVSPSAAHELARLSGGLPKTLFRLAAEACVSASVRGLEAVDVEAVEAACKVEIVRLRRVVRNSTPRWLDATSSDLVTTLDPALRHELDVALAQGHLVVQNLDPVRFVPHPLAKRAFGARLR